MILRDGFHAVPDGWLATIVTHLEMTSPPPPAPAALPPDLAVQHEERPSTDWYRALFTRIGADWLWTSRLELAASDLAGIVASPDVEVWTLRRGGEDLALCELDFRAPGSCELAFFGLDPRLQGRGLSHPLLAHATARAWTRPIRRFTVHTCTHDHPAALGLYRGAGFVPVRREVEVMPDPRLSGLLPADAAPHVPSIRAPATMDGTGARR